MNSLVINKGDQYPAVGFATSKQSTTGELSLLSRMQRGFTQVEVLVSVLVLAIGILGMGTLQLTSLQNSTNSVLRTQAVYLSYEILDRIRANSATAIAALKTSGVGLGAPTATESCIGANCTAAKLLAFDIIEWKCALGKYAEEDVCKDLHATSGSLMNLDSGLPSGDGSISINASNEYTITIQWQEGRSDGENAPPLTSFQLKGVL